MRLFALSLLVSVAAVAAQDSSSTGFRFDGIRAPGDTQGFAGSGALIPDGKGGLRLVVEIDGQTYSGRARRVANERGDGYQARDLQPVGPPLPAKSQTMRAGTAVGSGPGEPVTQPIGGLAQGIDPTAQLGSKRAPRGRTMIAGAGEDGGAPVPVDEAPAHSVVPTRARILVRDGQVRVRLYDEDTLLGQGSGEVDAGLALEPLNEALGRTTSNDPAADTLQRALHDAEQAQEYEVSDTLQGGSLEEVSNLAARLEARLGAYRQAGTHASNLALQGTEHLLYDVRREETERAQRAVQSQDPALLGRAEDALNQRRLQLAEARARDGETDAHRETARHLGGLGDEVTRARIELEQRAMGSGDSAAMQRAVERLEDGQAQLDDAPSAAHAEAQLLGGALEKRRQELLRSRDEAWQRQIASNDPAQLERVERELVLRSLEVKNRRDASGSDGERASVGRLLDDAQRQLGELEQRAASSGDYATTAAALERSLRREQTLRTLADQAGAGPGDVPTQLGANSLANDMSRLEYTALTSGNPRTRQRMRAQINARVEALEASGDLPGELERLQDLLEKPLPMAGNR